MAESKTAVAVFFLVALVVAAASVPAASADKCNEDCYKQCEQGKKDPFCSKCDNQCLIEAANHEYAAAKPAEKKAVAAKLRKQFESAAAAARTPGKAKALISDCINICSNESKRCGNDKKDPPCVARCESACRAEVDSLSFVTDLYAASGDSEKENLIDAVAVDKHADGPKDTIRALSNKCVDDCRGNSCLDPTCTYECIDGCWMRYMSFAFAMDTPAKRDAIYNDFLDINVKREAEKARRSSTN